MTAEGVRIPTASETVQTYVARFTGLADGKRGAMLFCLVVLGVPLVLPPIDWERDWTLPAVLISGFTIDAVRRERRLGGPDRLAAIAGLTTAAIASVYFTVALTIWVNFGGRLELWANVPPIHPPVEVLVLAILAGEALLFYIIWRTRPGREPAEEEFEAEVRAERARRGAPPERRRWA
jgi:hypothetical protein